MKRPGSSDSDSLGAFMSICRSTEEQSPRNMGSPTIYGIEFDSMMMESFDDEGCIEEMGRVGSEKKRRLGVDQVKALEKNFEVENKLEPERKVQLAQELGLQPRQVAVWFQNRRARWKRKQLERDYGVLKANYDSLKLNYESLQRGNEALLKEIKDLKSKLNKETNSDDGSHHSVKNDPTMAPEPNSTNTKNLTAMDDIKPTLIMQLPELPDLSKEHNIPSDSDSSAILNEENNSNSSAPISSSSVDHHLLIYQPQFVKMEEHNFFDGDEACDFFFNEQPPTLQWYCPDQWN